MFESAGNSSSHLTFLLGEKGCVFSELARSTYQIVERILLSRTVRETICGKDESAVTIRCEDGNQRHSKSCDFYDG